MDGGFDPWLIQKGQTRIDGMDDSEEDQKTVQGLFSRRTIRLYAAGLSTCDIRAHLEEVYGLKVSADLISRVTDAVLEEVSDWQNRVLEPMYPIVFPRCPTRQNPRRTKPSGQEQGSLRGPGRHSKRRA
ncbi:MAG: putative transposase [Paracoccaceae bacterium]|jgi:transposase-like protein